MVKPMWSSSNIPFIRNNRPLVFAHRGNSFLSPESSMLAFKQAYNLKVDSLEADVRLTKDNIPVIFHDETLERTTNGVGSVYDYTYEELQDFNLGYNHKDPDTGRYAFRDTNLSIITLNELISTFNNIRINLDIKDKFKQAPKIIAQSIKAHDLEQKIMVGSFYQKQINTFRDLSNCPTSAGPREVLAFLAGFVTKKKNYHALQVPLKAGIVPIVTKMKIKRAHKLRIAVHPWTINDSKTMRYLLEMGVDGIFSDFPIRLLEIVEEFMKKTSS